MSTADEPIPTGDTAITWYLPDFELDLDLIGLKYLQSHYPEEFGEEIEEVPDHLMVLLKDQAVQVVLLKYLLKVMWVGQTIKNGGGNMLKRLGGMVEVTTLGREDDEAVYDYAVLTAEVGERMLAIVPPHISNLKFVALRGKNLHAVGTHNGV